LRRSATEGTTSSVPSVFTFWCIIVEDRIIYPTRQCKPPYVNPFWRYAYSKYVEGNSRKKQKAEKNKLKKKKNFVIILPFFSGTKICIKCHEGSLKRKIYTLQGGITAISTTTKWSLLSAIGDEKTIHNAVTIVVFSYGFGVSGYSSG